MDEQLNMPLRTEILEMALLIEDCMTKLLQTFLVIDKEDTRTLSNRSSSLSFKQKIDLLFDLDVLTKEENTKLLLLMEFRNQFLHNISCNSFEAAVLALDGQKKNLLKFDDLNGEHEIEFRLSNAYSSLHVACLDIVLEKYEFRRSQLESRRKVVTDMAEYMTLVMNSDTVLLNKIMTMCTPEHGDTAELISLKMNVHQLIDEHTTELKESAEYLEMNEKLKGHLGTEQMKAFFRR
jgi:hypothetical protein